MPIGHYGQSVSTRLGREPQQPAPEQGSRAARGTSGWRSHPECGRLPQSTLSGRSLRDKTSLGVQAPGCPKLRQGAAYILLRVREHASRGWNNKLKPEQGVGVCTRSGCTLVCEHAPYSRGWNNKHQAAQQTRPRPQPEAGAQHPDTRLRFRSTREQPAHGCLRTGVPKGRGSQRTAAQNTRTSLFGVRTRLGQPVRELARDRFVGRGLAYWCTAPGGWGWSYGPTTRNTL